MKSVFWVIIVTILLAPVTAFAQRTRSAGTSPPPELAAVDEKTDPINDFYKDGLPDAEILGGPASPSLATEVARRVSEYDDDSLSVLIAALQKAGFYIIDVNGKTLYRPISGDGMGMAFYDFEVVGMLKASGLGGTISLDKLTQTIAGDKSPLPASALPPLILRDLESARSSEDPQVAFLAALIMEFGRQSPVPLDIAGMLPGQVKLNIIQASLVERVLLRDFIKLYESFDFPDEEARLAPAQLFKTQSKPFGFVKASWFPAYEDPCASIGTISSVIKAEKTGKKTIETVKIYKEMMKSIENTAETIGKQKTPTILTGAQGYFKDFAKGISIVNAALNWMKLVVALSHVTAKVTVEDPMPLIRTKSDRNTGQERTVTAAFKMEIANTEMINCAGKALGIATGVSFSVPDGGPMTGKPVSWEVVMTGDKYKKYENTPVWVDAVNRSDISKQTSDANGESKIILTGKPQPENLEQQPVVPLAKKADLRVSIALEKMDFKTDAGKIGKLGLGGKIDPVSIIEIVPDMLGKMKLSTFSAKIPIRDWQPCSEDWGGTITYKKVISPPVVMRVGAKGARQISESTEVNVTLNPRTPEEMKRIGPKPADIVARGTRSDITEAETDPDPCCSADEKEDTALVRTGTIDKFSIIQKGTADVRYRSSERDYSLSLNFSVDSFQATRLDFREILRSSCILDQASAFSNESEYPFAVGGFLPDGRYAGRFENEAGTILQGQKTLPNQPDGSTITWEWSLARCKS